MTETEKGGTVGNYNSVETSSHVRVEEKRRLTFFILNWPHLFSDLTFFPHNSFYPDSSASPFLSGCCPAQAFISWGSTGVGPLVRNTQVKQGCISTVPEPPTGEECARHYDFKPTVYSTAYPTATGNCRDYTQVVKCLNPSEWCRSPFP